MNTSGRPETGGGNEKSTSNPMNQDRVDGTADEYQGSTTLWREDAGRWHLPMPCNS